MKTRMPIVAILVWAWIAAAGSSRALAQGEFSPGNAMTSVYVELFGQNSFFSLNYDRMLGERFGLRAGFGMSGLDGTDGFIIPITAHYLRGNDHRFELGAGLVYENGTWQRGREEIAPILSIGYRYQQPEGGFMFRVAINAIWYLERAAGAVTAYDDDTGLEPGIALSFGYAF